MTSEIDIHVNCLLLSTFVCRKVEAEQQFATSSITIPTGRLEADLSELAETSTSNPPVNVSPAVV